MEDTYTLNPFATVAEVPDGFLIHMTSALQVRFAKRDKPFVDLLLSGQPLPVSALKRYLAANRISELRQKKVLLEKVPPTDGRYSRQLGFFSLISDDFDGYQRKLQEANVLLLGAGAIGSHVLWNLAAIGVKQITVVDFDTVEETNLNRQLMYTPADVGQLKVNVLCSKIAAFNPDIEIMPVNLKIQSAADIEPLLEGKTLVIKAIDTPEQATEWINVLCVKHRIPFITGGFIDYAGVVGPMYIPGKSLCTACLGQGSFKRIGGTGPTFGPLTTIVSSMLSNFAAKIIAGSTDAIANKIYMYDALADRWEITPLTPARPCPVCGLQPEPQKTAVADKSKRRLWAFQGSIALLTIIAAVIRTTRHDPYVGILALAILFLSVPIIDWLSGSPAETRRQIFAATVIYCLISLVAGLAQNATPLFSATGTGFDAFFGFVQQIGLAVLVGGMTISLLFFILNAFMYGLKIATRQRGWIA